MKRNCGCSYRRHSNETNWQKSHIGSMRIVCCRCGPSGHLRKGCKLERRAFARFGQEYDLTCKAISEAGNIGINGYRASMSMIRAKHSFQIGFRSPELDVTNQKIYQADRIAIKVLVNLPAEVGRAVMMQQMYVTLNLRKSIILGREWLQTNEAHISLNPTLPLLKMGKREILFRGWKGVEIAIKFIENVILRMRTAITCIGWLSSAGEGKCISSLKRMNLVLKRENGVRCGRWRRRSCQNKSSYY